MRPFRWNDVEPVANLLRTAGSHTHRDWPDEPGALEAELRMPRAEPERNILLAEAEPGIAGCAIVEPELNIGRAIVSIAPTEGHTASDLLSWALARSWSIGASTVHTASRDGPEEFTRLLGGRGFRQVRTFLRMRLPDVHDGWGAIESAPPGYAIRQFEADRDEELLTDLQNDIFSEAWGYSPNTLAETRARLAIPGFGPENVLFLLDGEGLPVGYNWSGVRVQSGSRYGRIHMTGVLPAFRGKGLGSAVVTAGLRRLAERGAAPIELDVDSENAPAMVLYLRLGFRPVCSIHWFELRRQA